MSESLKKFLLGSVAIIALMVLFSPIFFSQLIHVVAGKSVFMIWIIAAVYLAYYVNNDLKDTTLLRWSCLFNIIWILIEKYIYFRLYNDEWIHYEDYASGPSNWYAFFGDLAMSLFTSIACLATAIYALLKKRFLYMVIAGISAVIYFIMIFITFIFVWSCGR